MKKAASRQSPIMKYFSTLAGPLTDPKDSLKNDKIKIRFNPINYKEDLIFRLWSYFISIGSVIFTIVLAAVLLKPSSWEVHLNPGSATYIQDWVMLVCLFLMQFFIIITTLTAARSTLKARDPVPLEPVEGMRVAFATTRAPGEPVSMVVKTLKAALKVRYDSGKVDVWLLDETADPELQRECKKLGVRYFSRNGKLKWNQLKPQFSMQKAVQNLVFAKIEPDTKKKVKYNPLLAAKTKHGNFNSWMEHLKQRKINYDILAGVDTDQVPEPNYLERTLGYFHDENVAFVVGPQVYGNYRSGLRGLVVRCAESQASFFQSTLQRAANADGIPMFVGTNYTIRMSVLRQIGGFQACITEDMATSLTVHAHKNPDTKKAWRSVYTPDVLAVGEGPDFWGPYFTQQWRWAAGAMDTWRKIMWRKFFRLPGQAKIHYPLMMCYYPLTALSWLVGIISSSTYLLFGATAVEVPWKTFISLYAITLCLQLSMYFWDRRHNVSPHEPQGSYGVAGLLISALATPIYFSALVGTIVGKKAKFVVTTKGSSDNPDWFKTFKLHVLWGVLISSMLAVGLRRGHTHPAILAWCVMQLLVCVTPPVLGLSVAIPDRIRTYFKSRRDTKTVKRRGVASV